MVPGTHTPLLSYDTETGEPDPDKERLYAAANRLDPYGFAGWIGPEPHGSDPLRDSGSSAPGQKGRDAGYAQQTVRLIEQLDHNPSAVPWLVVSSFVNPHDIGMWGLWANLGKDCDFHIEEGVVPPGEKLFLPDFDQSLNEDLATKPSCQKSYQESYAIWMQPVLGKLGTWNPYYRFYYQVHKNVDEEMTVKATPKSDEFEMYNVTDDPMELKNLYGVEQFSSQQMELAQLLEEQRAKKRLGPWSGHVPGQPI